SFMKNMLFRAAIRVRVFRVLTLLLVFLFLGACASELLHAQIDAPAPSLNKSTVAPAPRPQATPEPSTPAPSRPDLFRPDASTASAPTPLSSTSDLKGSLSGANGHRN